MKKFMQYQCCGFGSVLPDISVKGPMVYSFFVVHDLTGIVVYDFGRNCMS